LVLRGGQQAAPDWHCESRSPGESGFFCGWIVKTDTLQNYTLFDNYVWNVSDNNSGLDNKRYRG